MITRQIRTAALILAGVAVVAGCTSNTAPSTGSKSGSASTPVAGGTLTVAVPAAPATLDPAKIGNGAEIFDIPSYDSLISRNAQGTLIPSLATSWSYGAGNLSFSLTLRSGVKFADGEPLTAQAVKESLDYSRQQGAEASLVSSVSSVTVTGPLSVRLNLTKPDPILPDVLTEPWCVGNIIAPGGLAQPAKLGTATFGSGPYQLDAAKTETGATYTFVATPGYWNKSAQHYQQIVMKVIANPASALSALRTGQVDVAVGDQTTVAAAKSDRLQVAAQPFTWQGLDLIGRSQAGSPLSSLGVRQAINYALNRSQITSALFGSYGLATDEIAVPGGDGYVTNLANYYPYNPAKAKALLAAAGYSHGFSLSVISTPLLSIGEVAQVIAQQLQAVGIHLNLDNTTNPVNYATGMGNHKYQAVEVDFGALPVYQEGPLLFLPGGQFNGFNSTDAQLSTWFDQSASASASERSRLDQDIVGRLVTQAWFAPVTFTPEYIFARSGIAGLDLSAGAPIPDPLHWYDTK